MSISTHGILSGTMDADNLVDKSATAGLPFSGLDLRRDARANGEEFAAGIWKCEPCTFEWTQDCDEAFHIVEGEGVLEPLDGGDPIELRPGVLVALYPGQRKRWVITKTIKKFFVAVK